MKKSIYIIAAICSLSFLSCSKDSPSKKSNVIRLCVQADKQAPGIDDGTKASYNWTRNEFAFEDDDLMQILIGKTSGSSVTKQTSVRIPMVAPGKFVGDIDLGDYELSDIRGAVLVKESTPSNLYTLGFYNSNLSVTFDMIKDQTQSASNVFSDASGRFFLYAPVPQSALSYDPEDNVANITKLTFGLSTAIWEYHIFGTGRSDEKVESITVSAAGSSVSAKYIMTCKHMINAGSGGHQAVNGNYAYTSSVTLDTPFAIPQTSADAGIIFHCVYGSSSNAKALSTVTIATDKAVYKKVFGGALSPATQLGIINPIYIDLSADGGFTRYSKAYEISTDGGTTWTEWTGDLPSGTASTSLTVRSGAVLTSAKLTEIKNWINSQSGTVALDLSGISYESATFPTIFGNETAANACSKLHSIRFPSNVTGFSSGAFRNCTGLADVDFSNITSISGESTDCHTFRGCTALTEINLPKLTTMGRYTFYGCSNLVKITFGPNVTKFGGRSMESCPKLADIFVYATTPPSQNGNTYFLSNSGSSVDASKRFIHVPAGCVDTYNSFSCKYNSKSLTPWKESVTGYTLVEIE